MSRTPVRCIVLTCDSCGTRTSSEREADYYPSLAHARADGWETADGSDLCISCADEHRCEREPGGHDWAPWSAASGAGRYRSRECRRCAKEQTAAVLSLVVA
ncbi:MAG: hypothetical protein QM779_15785 [Propionicimonas sp.]|uniref:hypothetical protein n=1 Tax=Propionicimonas sp. TaxID=1955623 RepID=UPI003D0C3B64